MVPRELTSGEADLFRSIRLEALSSDPDAFGETLEHASALDENAWDQRLARFVNSAKSAILVIEDDVYPRAICYVGIRDDDATTGFLGSMFVSPAFRRRGCGKVLLDAAEKWIQDCGGSRVWAKVAAPNDSAIRFYKSCGYTLTGEAGKLREGSNISVYEIEKQLT